MFHDLRPLRFIAQSPEARADALVLALYRGAVAGLSQDSAAGTHGCWRALIAAMPPDEARAIFREFDHFVRTLVAAAERPLQRRPATSPTLASDEAQILRLIAAAQCSDYCRLHEVAAKLLLGENLVPALEATQSLAGALAARRLFVSDP